MSPNKRDQTLYHSLHLYLIKIPFTVFDKFSMSSVLLFFLPFCFSLSIFYYFFCLHFLHFFFFYHFELPPLQCNFSHFLLIQCFLPVATFPLTLSFLHVILKYKIIPWFSFLHLSNALLLPFLYHSCSLKDYFVLNFTIHCLGILKF